MIRLNRYLAQCGVASRRAAEEFIVGGRVTVNGTIETNLARQVDPVRDQVEVGGLPVSPSAEKIYWALNKPAGYDVTRGDPFSDRNVFELLPMKARPGAEAVQAVGRLDRDTTGLLLLTNDGELANRLAHPRYGVEKEYLAFGPEPPTEEQMRRLKRGLRLEDGPARVSEADAAPQPMGRPAALRVVIHLGRKRIVRRMCEEVGFALRRLHRSRVGPIPLGNLASGRWRELTPDDVAALRKAAGLKPPPAP